MTDNNAAIVLTVNAEAIVRSDVNAYKRDGKRYAAYVAEMAVTSETVADHVAIFRDAYRASFPKSKPADGAAVKAYATKVRNGLNYHVAKSEPAVEPAEGAEGESAEGDVEPAVEGAPVDYLALAVQAAQTALDNGVGRDDLHRALVGFVVAPQV